MYNDIHRQILKALQIADDLMEFANDEAGNAQETGCDILSGLMRDCAYKIRRQAEIEGHKAKKNWVHANALLMTFVVAVLSIIFASPANATTIILSINRNKTLGGLTFSKNELAEYDPSTDTATLYFNGNIFSGPGASPNLDAVSIVPEPSMIALLGLGCIVLVGRKRR